MLKRGRAGPKVNGNVEDCSLSAANHFALRKRRRLVVNTPEGSLSRVKGYAALRQSRVQSMIVKFFLAPGTCKETALVRQGLESNFENPGNLGFMKNHVLVVWGPVTRASEIKRITVEPFLGLYAALVRQFIRQKSRRKIRYVL